MTIIIFLMVLAVIFIVSLVAIWNWASGKEKRPPSKDVTDALEKFKDSLRINRNKPKK